MSMRTQNARVIAVAAAAAALTCAAATTASAAAGATGSVDVVASHRPTETAIVLRAGGWAYNRYTIHGLFAVDGVVEVERVGPGEHRGLPMMGSSHTARPEDLDMPDATFACPDLTMFCRLDELGLQVTGQRIEAARAVLACRVVDADRRCRR